MLIQLFHSEKDQQQQLGLNCLANSSSSQVDIIIMHIYCT